MLSCPDIDIDPLTFEYTSVSLSSIYTLHINIILISEIPVFSFFLIKKREEKSTKLAVIVNVPAISILSVA